MIGVTEDCITLWENNRSKPYVKYCPKIIEFLGYVPFEVDSSTLGGRIKLYRYLCGLSQKDLAYALNIDESTVLQYEKNRHKPTGKTYKKLEFLLQPSTRYTSPKGCVALTSILHFILPDIHLPQL